MIYGLLKKIKSKFPNIKKFLPNKDDEFIESIIFTILKIN